MEPRDKDGRTKLKECEDAWRKQRFEEAITTPEIAVVSLKPRTCKTFRNGDKVSIIDGKTVPCAQVKMSDSLDVKGMVVDASYTGPKLEEDCIITKEFVSNMVHHFKQCYTIHSRCAIKQHPFHFRIRMLICVIF